MTTSQEHQEHLDNYIEDDTAPNPNLEFQGAADEFIKAYNRLAKIVHDDNVKKGFWPCGRRNVGEALMLAVTELSEAMEADRKDLMDQHLPLRMGQEVEIADCIIRLMDLGHGLHWCVAEALIEKLLYNRSRPFKHGKKC